MDSKEYVEGVLVTESVDLGKLRLRITDENIRLLHAAMGLVTEAGEFMDMMKKHIYYGKPLDKTNLIEELGDLFWYCGVASDVLGISFDKIMQINHDKLFLRYKKGFSAAEAINRDLDKERALLEAGNKTPK